MSSRNSARRKKENVRFEKEPLVTVTFFSPKGIHFTTNSSNPSVLLQYLHPGKIRWIKRTGRPERIK
jgi:hypothetical protein